MLFLLLVTTACQCQWGSKTQKFGIKHVDSGPKFTPQRDKKDDILSVSPSIVMRKG